MWPSLASSRVPMGVMPSIRDAGACVATTRKRTSTKASEAATSRAGARTAKATKGGSASRDEGKGPGPLRRWFGAAAGAVGSAIAAHSRDVWGIVLLLAAVISGLAIYLEAAGPVGRVLDAAARGGFGLIGVLVPVLLLVLGAALFMDRTAEEVGRLGTGVALTTLAVLGGAHLLVDVPAPGDGLDDLARGGGIVGWLVAAPLDLALSRAGAWAVIVALLLLGLVLALRLDLRAMFGAIGDALMGLVGSLRGALARSSADASDAADASEAPAAAEVPEAVLGPDAYDEPPVEARAVVDVWLDDDPEDMTTELPPVVDVHEAPTERIELVSHSGDAAEDLVGDEDGDDAEESLDAEAPDAVADADADADAVATPVKARKVLPPGQERPYELPPLDLLSTGRALGGDPSRTIAAQSKALQETFDQFGINAKVARSSRGPTVTRFEVEIGPGVKVNKVANLGDDIAYALAAPDVRIVAPIPGKSAIGIEVPNTERDLISLGDVLRSDTARRDEHPLSVALGVDIAGAPAMVDLSKMPHLLVSGSTGSGKSVTLNGMIASVLMRARPDQVRMLLIDPKRVELGVYEGAPHLLAPVVTDPRRAADAVAWCVKEMEQRYELLALLGFRNIDGYNDAYDRGDLADRPGPDGTAIPPKRMPYILLVIDELADLMLVAPRDVEDAICRIAQMARAVGIHMVIATQRPSVDVITGLIKANIPSRLALAVASQTDSRTILDAGGAEKLVGRGDMLFLPASQGKPSRMQGCWVTEEEIASVVTFCRTQREPVFEQAVASTVSGASGPREGFGARGDDEGDAGLLRRAAEQVVSSGLGSTSMLQRKLRIGFARAGRLMDELEEVGCVGPSEGSKAREVLWDEERLRAALESGLI
jgi:S-DNA-T family DNA segregation ATPase FtsK/SpoIIIE